MKKQILVVFGVLALSLVLAVLYILRAPAAASEPISAIPLEVESATSVVDEEATATLQTEADETETAEPTDEAEMATASPTASATSEIATEVDEAKTGGELIVYQISQNDSQVTFELDEDLRGERITVVGTTGQVAGEIALNLNDLTTTQVGVIQINARTLVTDNEFRNRAMQNEILDTGSYEYITFTPKQVSGLPASVAVGEEVSFTITGDLTIRDVTQSVTFEVVATALSETELSGKASTTILRDAFNLTIPSAPGVANVEEEVSLSIEFVANAA